MRFTTTFLLTSITIGTMAQHCGYDFASIIVVRPHLAGDTTVTEDLRLTLLDSNNVPVMDHGRPWYQFKRNADYEACAQWQGRFSEETNVCFPFAKDNYVLVIPHGFATATMKVLIQDERPRTHVDIRRRHWPKRYRQQIIPLTAFDSHSLCGTYNDAVYQAPSGRPAYHPVDVILYEE